MLWLFLFDSTYSTLYFPAFPPVCSFLPPQLRAAAGALQEGQGKLVRLRYQRGEDTYDFLYLHTLTEGDAGKMVLLLLSFFSILLKLYNQIYKKGTAADGTVRTLSSFDRAFINVPMAEARDFHCHILVTDKLGERSKQRHHVAIRVVRQKPLAYCSTIKRIPNWMAKHPVFCAILKRISDVIGSRRAIRRPG